MKPELFLSGTAPTLEGEYIQPCEDKSVLEGVNVLTGQIDPMLAHSWALRNYEADVVFSLGQMQFSNDHYITYAIARNRESFLKSLHVTDGGQIGGFIHKVDVTGFELRPDRIGQMKWLSHQPAKVLAPPRFVSLQHVMSQGVQVYILEDENFISTLAEGRKQHPLIINDGLVSGALTCLNEAHGFEKLAIPVQNVPVEQNATTSGRLSEPVKPVTSPSASQNCSLQ